MRYIIEKFEASRKISVNGEVGKISERDIEIKSYINFYVCKNCGSELYSEYQYPFVRINDYLHTRGHQDSKYYYLGPFAAEALKLKDEAKKRCQAPAKGCPVCGATLMKEEGFFAPDPYGSSKEDWERFGYADGGAPDDEKFEHDRHHDV